MSNMDPRDASASINTFRDVGSTAIYTAYTVDTVYTVYTVYNIQTAFHCLNTSMSKMLYGLSDV